MNKLYSELFKLFYYDETSPSCLRWKIDRWTGRDYRIKKRSAGDSAGSVNGKGYWYVSLAGKSYPVHRIVWILFNKVIPSEEHIDHIDGGRSNLIVNLRSVPRAINNRNRKVSKSNYYGVSGIYHRINNGHNYLVSVYNNIKGKRVSRYFSIAKLGIMVAFRDAVIHRQKMIEELNSKGAGYMSREKL